MSSILISGARILDAASGYDAIGHLGIRGTQVDYIGESRPDAAYDETIEASGLWLMPGLVDLAVRLREPGQARKGTIRSELTAARAGGVTSLCIYPDTQPVIDTPSVLDWINQRVDKVASADVYALAALTRNLDGETLAELGAMAHAGCVGTTQAGAALANAQLARRALEYAANFNLTVHVQPTDASLAGNGCAHEGAVATRLGLPGIPVAAETVAIAQWLALVEQTGASLHFARISSARGLELIRTARAQGLPVSCDVAVHQLLLCDKDINDFDPMLHLHPPLRGISDRDALRAGVADGSISAICSDHQPHDIDAKVNPFPMTEAGISGLETLLPLTLSLVNDGLLSALDAVARISTWPALLLGIPAGSLAVRETANLVLVDPNEGWTLQADQLLSAGKNSAFNGWTLRGRVKQTFYRGQPVYKR